MSLDRETLRFLAAMGDDIGILSIYVTVRPRGEPTPRPAWELRLRGELEKLRAWADEHLSKRDAAAVHRRLDALRPQLDQLVDPAAPGQGRALFAAVAGQQVRTVSLQVPMVDAASFGARPQLRPLLAAWGEAGPAGAVSVSAEELRIVDLRFGLAEDVQTLAYEPDLDHKQLKGPSPAQPGMAQPGVSHRDLFARKEGDRLARWLRGHGPRLAQLAVERGWDHLALTGEPSLVQAVVDGLPPALPAEVLTLDHPVAALSTARLAATVAPALEEARQRQRLRLAERVRGAALGSDGGAYGLGETLQALQQGRVAHLLVVGDGQWHGRRAPDGTLVPDGEVPPGVDERALLPEPHLGDRMVELAFQSSADVTVLDPVAGGLLAEADGIGALLRW